MCGITGFLSQMDLWPESTARKTLEAMANSIRHRGPDDAGYWLDETQAIALAHRRLSILDLSQAGHQPMLSSDDRYVIVFNGEIYNFQDLLRELEGTGSRFHSSSDTEVLLEAIVKWGLGESCKRLVGMFAFALWDRLEQRLSLVRDRIGKKPLYVYQDQQGGIAFASELKAFWYLPAFNPVIDKQALAEFFRFSYIPDYLCIFEQVQKVMPGTIQEYQLGKAPRTHSYWSLAEVATTQAKKRITRIEDAEEQLLSVLKDATQKRMLADVPLGAFLSGGIDSGLIVSLMREYSSQQVKTFSIGFTEASYDEAPIARAVAQHLGTDHHEMYVSEAEAQEVVPLLPEMFDEPFADASQIPTYLVAKKTRGSVTVAMTGDGGDESFGGYLRYRNHSGLLGALYHLPLPMRKLVAGSLASVPAKSWESLVSFVPYNKRPRFIASKVAKISRALRLENATERGKAFLSFWEPEEILRAQVQNIIADPFTGTSALLEDPSEAMQYWETLHYLSGDLLVKVDRASMFTSLEARAPLLDHRVVELAWQLPSSMKASPMATKRILRNLLYRYVPREIIDLPKQGFSVPIGKWLTDGLLGWSEDLFGYGRTHTSELLNWVVIDEAWQKHRSGQVGYAEKLWIVLMFCAWHRYWFASSDSELH